MARPLLVGVEAGQRLAQVPGQQPLAQTGQERPCIPRRNHVLCQSPFLSVQPPGPGRVECRPGRPLLGWGARLVARDETGLGRDSLEKRALFPVFKKYGNTHFIICFM